MSHETVRNFFQSIETDELLQEQVKNASNSASVLQIASNKGYDFNLEELQEYMQERAANEELSLKELEAVAGGTSANIINGGTNNIN